MLMFYLYEMSKQDLRAGGQDREKLEELLAESFRLHRSQPEQAIELANEALRLATRLQDPLAISKAHYRIGCANRSLTLYAKAIEHLDLSIAACEQVADIRQLSAALHIKGSVLSLQGSHLQAKAILSESASIRKQLGLNLATSDTLGDLATTLFRLGDYAGALAALYECLQLLEGSDEPLRLSIVLSIIASIYIEANFNEKAEEYLQQALEHARADVDGDQESALRLKAYALHASSMSSEESLQELTAIQELLTSTSRKDLTIDVKLHLAEVRLDEGKNEAARSLATAALELAQELGLQLKIVEAYTLIGDITISFDATISSVRSAEIAYTSALDIAAAIGCLVQAAEAASKLAMYYRGLGQTELALEYLIRERDLLNEFNIEKQQRAVPQLQARIELERAERERERLSIENASLTKERERNNTQLASLALHLVHKNEFLAEIRESVSQSADGDDLVRRINEHVRSDKDWQQFEDQLNAMQGDFLNTLARRFPDVTLTERKVVTLMRLNLSSKAVASLLCLSVRTVENHRLSIRKKLGLINDVNLTTFLSSL